MSDSDESFDIPRDIKPYNFEPLVKKVTYSINCDELAAASAYVDPEQPTVPLTLLCIFVDRRLNFNVHIYEIWKKAGKQLSALDRVANILSTEDAYVLFECFII